MVRGGRQGIRVREGSPCGNCTGMKATSCMASWDGVPKGCPFCLRSGAEDPRAPSAPLPCLGSRNGHQDSFAPSAATRRWPAGYRQPGCDFIHCFVSQCQSAVFHIIPGPHLQLGEESSACSTGWGHCNLLFLLVDCSCLLLPQRPFSPQMLFMLECGFVFCDHPIEAPSPSGLDYLLCVPKFLCRYLTRIWDLSFSKLEPC